MNNATPLAYTVTPSSHPRSTEQRAALLAGDLGFGKHMTDHMVSIDWDAERGWHAARVQAYGPLALDPAAAVLHYGQEIFEGIKAYRHADGSIWTFRPQANGERLLLTGDIDRAAEQALLGTPLAVSTDWLQAPHHGSRSSSSRAFLQRLAPKSVRASAQRVWRRCGKGLGVSRRSRRGA